VKDYAIECAYGARRFQLFKQLFYSIIIVVVVGGVVSVNLLYGFVTILNKIVLPKLFASSFYISIPFMLVSVTLAGAFILVIISALASFLRISHLNVADVLKR
ncbi:FtsX-like permease family protein, partial [Sharpea azabuensis]